jgi:predicted PurR-regulated permease PerM
MTAWLTRRTVFLAVSAAAAVAIIVAARAVLFPFVLALVLAYVLTPAVSFVERARVPRWGAVLVVYALTLGIAGGSITIMVPRLVAEGKGLAAEWPRLNQRARDEWLPVLDAKISGWLGHKPAAQELLEREPVPEAEVRAPIRLTQRDDGSYDVHIEDTLQIRQKSEGVWQVVDVEERRGVSTAAMLSDSVGKLGAYVRENSLELLRIGQEIVRAVSSGIFNLFMTLMLGAYMILTRERILGFFRELWSPSSRESFDRFLRRLDRGLAGVVRGQLLICLVNGVLSAIGFWIFDLKYWPILSVIAGMMSIIPIFGSILSSVPAVAIGLTQSFGTAVGVLAWIVGIHQIEANFLNPKIIGDSAKIHPVLVVFALLAGKHFYQIAGALFAVPCLSVLQTIFLHFRESALGLADPMASIPPVTRRAALETPLARRQAPSEPPDPDEP